MTLKTRKPTGKPSWPITLLAGAEKAGKSYAAAEAANSDLIGRTWWITVGEDQPDEYGQLADFDIVEHDGHYRSILAALRDVGKAPLPPTGVPLLVVDSMTRLWDLLKENAQDTANARAAKRGQGNAAADAQITSDLWNAAAAQWAHVMDAIRAFPGPVVLTARLDVVAVMDDKGSPTKEKTSKVQAHKSLPYDVGVVVEMPARGETWLSGVRSLRFKLATKWRVPEEEPFTLDWLWRKLGLEGDDTTPREHAAPTPDARPFDVEGVAAGLDQYEDLDQLAALYRDMQLGKHLNQLVDGVPLGDLIRQRKELLVRRAEEASQHAMALFGAPTQLDPYEDETPF